MSRNVRIIPLADKGFVAVDPVYNPIRYYIEDDKTGKLLWYDKWFKTVPEAIEFATRTGLVVIGEQLHITANNTDPI